MIAFTDSPEILVDSPYMTVDGLDLTPAPVPAFGPGRRWAFPAPKERDMELEDAAIGIALLWLGKR